ncbi:leukocyte immunoglobulin-like receptor subfamily A member 6 [Myotis yumanensis]|uniref:leukocyte immunoglobulin-like receptor subfamily A member 6 n=1 Tax=Myotis yumanensis TaxID=159337 RepID=UPI0038D3EF71
MTSILSALLCLGLSLDQRTRVQAGTLPKPTIWAEPGPVIPWGSPVTIWCRGTLKAQEYRLYAGGKYLKRQKSLEPRDRAKFLITGNYAERYTCNYLSPTGRSGHSDPLELVVTGFYNKPSLTALPSPVVPSGGNVTLQCGSGQGFDRFILTKEGDHRLSWTLNSQPLPTGRSQALFPVGPMTPSHRWTFRCYGNFEKNPQEWSDPSDPLHLLVSGFYSKPSLSALPSPVVTSGGSVTLQCGSRQEFDTFILTKEGDHRLSWTQDSEPQPSGQFQALFPVGPVTRSHRWTFRCYGYYRNSPQVWSHPSDALELLVSGMYRKPSLSAQPGPSVAWGATVTLQCGSEIWLDTFHLHREGSLDPPQHLSLQDTSAPSQANFTLNSVNSGHRGTYRCYASHSTSPYLLSHPSDPLELLVSAALGPLYPQFLFFHPQDYTVENLIRIVVAGLILLVLGVLLFEARNNLRMTPEGPSMQPAWISTRQSMLLTIRLLYTLQSQ